MTNDPQHDPEGRRCILTTVRTLETKDSKAQLHAEELVDAILDALKREGLIIARVR